MKTKITIQSNILYPLKEELPFCLCGKCGMRVSNKNNKFINGHNSSFQNKKHTFDTKLRIANARKGKHHSNKTKIKMSKSSSERERGPLSNEHKLRLSKFHLGKKLSNETKLKISKNCKGMTDKHHSIETKLKISNASKKQIRKAVSQKTRLKLSNSLKGKKKTDNHKLKLSIATIKYIEKQKLNGGRCYPCEGSKEEFIFKELHNATGSEFLRNNRDLFFVVGKWLDGYLRKYNIDIEIDEPHHYNVNGELRKNDVERDLLVSSRLGCIVYRIKEQEFLKNPEKEIQRFKDFISLLEKETNENKTLPS